MSYQERRAIVSLISSVLITVSYAGYMVGKYPEANAYSQEVFHFWGSFFLTLILVSIVAKILVYIFFNIINAIATSEIEPDITDERDKLIGLKSARNGFLVFILGFALAMGALVINQPPSTMFIILVISGTLSEAMSDFSELYFYRYGV